MNNKIPSTWKNCATCTYWLGRQMPDVFNNYVEFDMNERAKCNGGGFNQCQVNGMASCSRWTPRFKK